MVISNQQYLKSLFYLCRPAQWIKNAFVLAPLVFTGLFIEIIPALNALLATLLFCIASSTSYIVNDLFDIESDRKHSLKSKTRPLASGELSEKQARILLYVLYGVLALGFLFSYQVMLVIIAYLALNLAYTYKLKHQPVIDIFTIACGFVLRVYAGAMALDVPVSAWMFITTLSLALYLATIKRRQELLLRGSSGREVLEKYSIKLVDRYAEMSATSALIFYSLFVMSDRPEMLVSIPLVLFGLFRYWFVVETLEKGESPTDVLLKDRQLLLTVLLWCLCAIIMNWPDRFFSN